MYKQHREELMQRCCRSSKEQAGTTVSRPVLNIPLNPRLKATYMYDVHHTLGLINITEFGCRLSATLWKRHCQTEGVCRTDNSTVIMSIEHINQNTYVIISGSKEFTPTKKQG